MDTTSSFGYWIRRQRKALDLTQQMLADKVGCSLAAVKKIEQDERHPSRQIAERMADILGVPTDQREIFLQCARGLRPVDQLSLARKPVTHVRPSGTVTFLFTDIEGSTKLSQEYAEEVHALLARHRAILNQAIDAYGGFVFQTIGDSFSVAFDTALNALNAASEAQRLLRQEAWSPAPIKVRMGIHTGSARLAEDPSIEGPYAGYATLALTQRIMSAAHGGQILLSHATENLLGGSVPKDVSLLALGEYKFKDILQPIQVFQVLAPDLPNEFPALRALDILPNNLPPQLTSFIGRTRELAEAKELLAKTRLLTLIGPGGTGKTRLSLQIAQEMLPVFADGVWFVELAPLTDPAFIPQAIASVLELRQVPRTPLVEVVTNYLRAKQLLLILDNCEHLIEAGAKLAGDLLRVCPQLKVIASSREALGISGEMIYRVPSLSLPDQTQVTRESIADYESIQLFVERANAAQSHFALTDSNASSVAQICHRLDGIPLALELAAARIVVFSPEAIASRLDDRFKLLTGGSRTALERHQTLQALIDWSYDLLSIDERTMLRHLSVFAGGWTFEAVEAICSDMDVLDLLTQLINKSLVIADVDAQENSTRYRLLETIRQYARDRLLEVGESNQVRDRHLDFFLQFVEQAASYYNGPEEMTWMSRLEAEDDNLRAALEWAVEHNVEVALRLGIALHPYWNRHRYEAEGRRLLSEVLARLEALPPVDGEAAYKRIVLQAKALHALGVIGFRQGDFLSSVKAFEESVILSRQIGEKYTLAWALSYIGVARAFLGDTEISYPAAEEGLILAREVGDKVLLGMALTNMARTVALTHGNPEAMRAYSEEGIQLLGEVNARWAVAMMAFGMGQFAAMQGNYAEARAHFETCLPLLTELRDRYHVNSTCSELAHLERQQGHFAQAKPLYRETLLEWQRLGDRAGIAHELECFAIIIKAQDEDTRAAQLFGAAEVLREDIKMPMTTFERVEYDREVNDLRANMDEIAFIKAWSEGRELTMEQAIVLALEEKSSDSPLPKSQ